MSETNITEIAALNNKPCPWSTPRGKLEYELALCDRQLDMPSTSSR